MTKYNDWTNYETWYYKLVQDQNGYDYHEIIQDLLDEGLDEHDRISRLAEILQDEFEESTHAAIETLQKNYTGMHSHYHFEQALLTNVSEINFQEVANVYISDYLEQNSQEQD